MRYLLTDAALPGSEARIEGGVHSGQLDGHVDQEKGGEKNAGDINGPDARCRCDDGKNRKKDEYSRDAKRGPRWTTEVDEGGSRQVRVNYRPCVPAPGTDAGAPLASAVCLCSKLRLDFRQMGHRRPAEVVPLLRLFLGSSFSASVGFVTQE